MQEFVWDQKLHFHTREREEEPVNYYKTMETRGFVRDISIHPCMDRIRLL